MLVAPGPIEVVQAIMRRRRERLGEGDRGMRHRLLVVGAVGRQRIASGVERFAEA